MRGSSDDDQLGRLRLHHVHRPGDGTSGSKGNSSTPLSDSLFLRYRSPIEICLEGAWRHLLRDRAKRSYPRSRRAVCAVGAKGLTARTSGAEPIGVAMIGCDHAWGASV